jgi:alanyl-tRNA synthetase
VKNRDFITGVITREEERFRQTLKTGMIILEREIGELNDAPLAGSTAFSLHDTYGFPLELTSEIAAEHDVSVDIDGFEIEMAEQRRRAKAARKGAAVDDERVDDYRELVEQFGIPDFVGYRDDEVDGRILAVLPGGDGTVEVFADRTPFYAEAGGQVGDTGTITTDTGVVDVLDTTYALPGLRRHVGRIRHGSVTAGQSAHLAIDAERRTAIRRNHTGTHVLHWALRQVLGEHVKQAGSLVSPDRLRFDFSHYAAVTPEEIDQIERLANREVLSNSPVDVYEVPKVEAEQMGAIAFFGDKYGDMVRVLRAGHSLELCGGTHVHATGDIGTIKIVSEGSIGSNLRRVEAVTGEGSVQLLQRDTRALADAARLLATTPDAVVLGIERKLEELRAAQEELKAARASVALGRASELAGKAVDGVVIERIDGLAPSDLRDLAIATRQQSGVRAAVLIGESDSGGVSLVAAVTADSGLAAGDLIRDAAKVVKGGGGGKGDVATAGGKDVTAIDEAIALARRAAGIG